MKTSELQGAALDWAVAKCEGYFSHGDGMEAYWHSPEGAAHFILMRIADGHGVHWTHSSTDWGEGGPIIEREMITVGPAKHEGYMAWAWPKDKGFWGDTPLIAAMRGYVASKLGDNITIPEELK